MTFNPEAAALVTPDTTIFWFRRDLRLEDNTGLYHALSTQTKVLALFIFDRNILDALEDKSDARVSFIYDSLLRLKSGLEEQGSTLLALHGDPLQIFEALHPKAVYANRDYDPYSTRRDEQVARILQEKNIPFYTFKDHVVFEKHEVVKDNGEPYTVFTPYSRKWKSRLKPKMLKGVGSETRLGSLMKTTPLELPSFEQVGFKKTEIAFPDRSIRMKVIKNYHSTRDFPAEETSRLSVHLRFGTISIRRVMGIALRTNDTWLNELIWREFYQMILWHFPQTVDQCFKKEYAYIPWRQDTASFEAWCQGRTGYPMVDAGMRELNATGFMHNRVRMITASFLTKHLLIDWRWGAAYFAEKLLDFELASNTGGWQWAAGCGCDAAPYFRVFNPSIQQKRFDPDGAYVRRWVPELETKAYSQPIIEHAFARERALQTFKQGLMQPQA